MISEKDHIKLYILTLIYFLFCLFIYSVKYYKGTLYYSSCFEKLHKGIKHTKPYQLISSVDHLQLFKMYMGSEW